VKARARLKVLDVLMAEQAYSDVIREAQEIVELCLKGMLRHVGVEPPKWHDVGGILQEHADRFLPDVRRELDALARASAWLRKEREFSFYGEIDFIPTEQYSAADAVRATDDARHVFVVAERVIASP
jgi:HEPN domain-containing protein